MGSGASSLQRLRKVLVIRYAPRPRPPASRRALRPASHANAPRPRPAPSRPVPPRPAPPTAAGRLRAYNARSRDETIEDQFAKVWRRDESGRPVLTKQGIRDALDIQSAPWIDPLLDKLVPPGVDRVYFEDFHRFLDTGEAPMQADPAAPTKFKRSASGMPPRPGSERRLQRREASSPQASANQREDAVANQKADERGGGRAAAIVVRGAAPQTVAGDSMYDQVYAALGFREPGGGAYSVVIGPSTALAVHRRGRKLLAHRGRAVWRKREIVTQERVVQYTTVNEEGYVQELVETERNQTEVVHLEAKDTGEFAHRETTNYEQTETFNDDVVAAQRGNEEYVHLKSLHDEYEHLESTMPPRAGAGGPATSPGGGSTAAGSPAEAEDAPSLAYLVPYLRYVGGRCDVFCVTGESTFMTEGGPRPFLTLKGAFLQREAAFRFSETLPPEDELRLLEDALELDASAADADAPAVKLENGLDDTCMFRAEDILRMLDRMLFLKVRARAGDADAEHPACADGAAPHGEDAERDGGNGAWAKGDGGALFDGGDAAPAEEGRLCDGGGGPGGPPGGPYADDLD